RPEHGMRRGGVRGHERLPCRRRRHTAYARGVVWSSLLEVRSERTYYQPSQLGSPLPSRSTSEEVPVELLSGCLKRLYRTDVRLRKGQFPACAQPRSPRLRGPLLESFQKAAHNGLHARSSTSRSGPPEERKPH